jgi:hypothetical protein
MSNERNVSNALKAAALLEYAETLESGFNNPNKPEGIILVMMALSLYGDDPAKLNELHTDGWKDKHYFDTCIPGTEAFVFENQVDRAIRSVILHFAAKQSFWYSAMDGQLIWGEDGCHEIPTYKIWEQIRNVASAFVGGVIAMSGPRSIDVIQFGRTANLSSKMTKDPLHSIGERITAGVFGIRVPKKEEGWKPDGENGIILYPRQRIAELSMVVKSAHYFKGISTDKQLLRQWLNLVFADPLMALDLKEIYSSQDPEELKFALEEASRIGLVSANGGLNKVYQLARDVIKGFPEEIGEYYKITWQQEQLLDF